jgi:parallel beta-helix repeat protein
LNTGNVSYTFTDNIYGRIVVERDSIVIDGAGYSLEGTGSHYGIDLSERNNITIKNTKITAFVRGIYLYKSSSINIYGNVITGNSNGIVLYRSSNQNIISSNNITESDYDGISSSESSNNSIYGNMVTGSDYGIYLDYSSHNNISENYVAHNKHGISIFLSSHNNTIQENNATENQEGMSLSLSSNNVLRLNTMNNNEFNIRVWGSNRSHFNNDVDSSNTVDGKSIYYWIGEQDLTVPLDAGFVVMLDLWFL